MEFTPLDYFIFKFSKAAGMCEQTTGSAKYLFLENDLKKLLNIFYNFFFYLKVQSFRKIISFKWLSRLGMQ